MSKRFGTRDVHLHLIILGAPLEAHSAGWRVRSPLREVKEGMGEEQEPMARNTYAERPLDPVSDARLAKWWAVKMHAVINCNTYPFSIYCERYIFLTWVYF